MNNNDLYSELSKCSELISKYIEENLIEVNIEDIKKQDGRCKNALSCCKQGNFIYYLYDKSNKLVYIGETGVTVKSRLFGDGSGSHKEKRWFNEVEIVKYYEDSNMDIKRRKSIERLLIQKHNPPYNDRY